MIGIDRNVCLNPEILVTNVPIGIKLVLTFLGKTGESNFDLPEPEWFDEVWLAL